MTDPSDKARVRFGAHADAYVTSETHANGGDLELLLSLAAVKPGESALDVATGGGHVALALVRAGARVTAIDLTPQMLEVAAANLAEHGATARFVEGSADALPFADESFDVVTCRIAAHHFPDPAAFFSEAARVLGQHGRLAFQDQALPDDPGAAHAIEAFERLRDPSHVGAHSVANWLALVAAAGLEVEAHTTVEKQHDFAEWCERQGCSAEVVSTLTMLAAGLGPAATQWLDPQWTHGARGRVLTAFTNRHVVLLARKIAD